MDIFNTGTDPEADYKDIVGTLQRLEPENQEHYLGKLQGDLEKAITQGQEISITAYYALALKGKVRVDETKITEIDQEHPNATPEEKIAMAKACSCATVAASCQGLWKQVERQCPQAAWMALQLAGWTPPEPEPEEEHHGENGQEEPKGYTKHHLHQTTPSL
jgi:hypothetical protein